MVKIGIIGGSGLDDPDILTDQQETEVATIYGSPSSAVLTGKINGVDVEMIARHGRRHELSPSRINYRGNIQAFKDRGVTHILATTACGSLRAEIGRGDFVILDQFIDFTRRRSVSFFDSFNDGARHTAMPEPFDPELRRILYDTSIRLGYATHERGTVITIEGPRFSTRAESNMFRIWGADVINMSVAPEAILANEAGIPYGVIAMSTDYDCWKEDEPPVSWDEILEVFHLNADRVKTLIMEAIPGI